jgi:hypothetical protein
MPLTVTGFAGLVDCEKSLAVTELAVTVTLLTNNGLKAWLDPRSLALRAAFVFGYFDLSLCPEDCFFKFDIEIVPEIITFPLPSALRTAEKVAEQVAENVIKVPAKSDVKTTPGFGRPEPVVTRPLFSVTQYRVCLIYFLEFLFGTLVTGIPVRVVG